MVLQGCCVIGQRQEVETVPVTVEAVSLWSLENVLISQAFASERELIISQQRGATNKPLQQAGLHLLIKKCGNPAFPQTVACMYPSVSCYFLTPSCLPLFLPVLTRLPASLLDLSELLHPPSWLCGCNTSPTCVIV